MSLNDPRWGGQGGGDREDGNRGDDNRNGDNRNDDLRGDRNRGGNQGPPDLEEVWRDFNQRLSGMFGGKRSGRGSGFGGGNGGGGGNRPELPGFSFKQFRGGFGVLAALVLVVWAWAGARPRAALRATAVKPASRPRRVMFISCLLFCFGPPATARGAGPEAWCSI